MLEFEGHGATSGDQEEYCMTWGVVGVDVEERLRRYLIRDVLWMRRAVDKAHAPGTSGGTYVRRCAGS